MTERSLDSLYIDELIDDRDDLRLIEEEVRILLNEVDCRIEHGAESGGHLEYVRSKLTSILQT